MQSYLIPMEGRLREKKDVRILLTWWRVLNMVMLPLYSSLWHR